MGVFQQLYVKALLFNCCLRLTDRCVIVFSFPLFSDLLCVSSHYASAAGIDGPSIEQQGTN